MATTGDPISQFVLKIHSRCDLACDHCYVYEHADQTWRGKPHVISPEVAGMAARRIAENAIAHGLTRVSVVLHGGEPLLAGKSRMRELLGTLTANITPAADLDLRIHSNGVRLDREWCALFSGYGVRVGISLDGDQAANDLHRKFADGRSSYGQVLAALDLLRSPEYRRLYAGILCTIDLASDPVAVYRALADQGPPNLDLLLPHATWASPPYRPAGEEAPYADWLVRVHDQWDRDGRRFPIRVFDSIISASRGGPSFTEALGTDPAGLLVIDTDGGWEQPDSMKTAFDGAAATGMNVFRHSADEAASHPAIRARQLGTGALSATCRSCEVVTVCGGGLYAHRYRPAAQPLSGTGRGSGTLPTGTEFDNPSVYCADLKALIRRVTAADRTRPAPVLATAERQPPQRPARHAGSGAWSPPALSRTAFDSLASGAGDADALSTLAAKRQSDTRLLIAQVARTAMDDASWRDAALRTSALAGWDLLCRLDREHPGAVRDVFAHPYAFAWARRCLRPPPGADSDLDRAHLASVAAAASIRAGVAVELPVPVRRGLMHVPMAGAVSVGARHGGTQVLVITPGRLPRIPGGTWRMARQVEVPPFAHLTVEDLDPFRDCQEWAVSGRLSATEWQAWRRRLITTGRRLADVVPGYACVLGAGLRAIVPLQQPGPGSQSATAWDAFGAVAIALPARQPARPDMGAVLLREFQHVKLNMLLDRYRLVNPAYKRRLHVPWRSDHQPAVRALRGSYALLAIAHLQRSRGRPGRAAYLRYRSWVADAAHALLSAQGALTLDGQRFVACVAAAAEAASD